MTFKDKRHGHFTDSVAAPFDSAFRHHDENGRGIARTKQEMRDAYRRIEERNGMAERGERIVFDCDGGLETAEERHRRRQAKQEEMRERVARIRARRQR